jgi:endonuclease YncB( thermonuclease family)
MKEINVYLGSVPGNGMHCFDGDSPYVSGQYENTLVRLLGIDAYEVRGMSLYYLRKSGFLERIDQELKRYLEKKLNTKSIQIHKELGLKGREYLENILEEKLVMSFEKEVFDKYGRALVYLSSGDQESYNLQLVREGYAIPYFIYPNAVSPNEYGRFQYHTIKKFREAIWEAQKKKKNIWNYANTIIPMELRFLTSRSPPGKYCADLENDLLYSPQYYFKVAIEDRLFFYPGDVLIAVENEFRPASDCGKWLHEVWRILHGRKEWQEDEYSERERRENNLLKTK